MTGQHPQTPAPAALPGDDLPQPGRATRAGHLAWAKERALEYADQGDLAAAVASLTSDLGKHPGTAGHPGIRAMTLAAMDGRLDTHARLRECIEGFT